VACHSIVYVRIKVLLYLAIAKHLCPAGTCQQSKHSVACPWLHSNAQLSLWNAVIGSLLVIVMICAKTAESIQMLSSQAESAHATISAFAFALLSSHHS